MSGLERGLTRMLQAGVLAMTLAACSDGRADPVADGAIPVSGRAWDTADAWRLEEDLRLGQVDGDGPEQFGQVGHILVDSAGDVYVLDIMSQEIRVFRSDGSFSHRIGGKGQGPGEFQNATGMAYGPGDTLWVLDPLAARYSAFTLDGTFQRSVARRIRGYENWPGRFLPDGRYVDWGFDRPGDGRTADGPRIVLHPIALHDFDQQDSLPPVEFRQTTAAIGGENRPVVFLSAALRYDFDSSGRLWFAHNHAYRLYRRDPRGDTTLIIELPVEAALVGEPERDYVRRRTAARPELTADYLKALPATRPLSTGSSRTAPATSTYSPTWQARCLAPCWTCFVKTVSTWAGCRCRNRFRCCRPSHSSHRRPPITSISLFTTKPAHRLSRACASFGRVSEQGSTGDELRRPFACCRRPGHRPSARYGFTGAPETWQQR